MSAGTDAAPSWLVIAKKDFLDSIRSYAFWGVSVVFLVLVLAVIGLWEFTNGALAFLAGSVGGNVTLAYVKVVAVAFKLVVPFIALLLGWKAIAGERESGSIKILLSLPHSRLDMVIGKLVGRTGVLWVAMVVGIGLATLPALAILESFDFGIFLSFIVVTLLFGMSYVAIAVSVSSLTGSTSYAAAGMFAVFLVFYVVDNVLGLLIDIVMSTTDYIQGVTYTRTIDGQEFTQTRAPNWAIFLKRFDPGTAYENALTFLTPSSQSLNPARFPDGVPFYLSDWFAFLLLLAWIVVPLSLAYLRFENADL